MAYMTTGEATARLSDRFGVAVVLHGASLEVAEQSLDRAGPFVGSRYAEGQAGEFPRDVTRDGDTEGEVPSLVLDWVALRAALLALGPAATPKNSSSISGAVSSGYARPRLHRAEVYWRNANAELERRYCVRYGEAV